MRYSAHPPCSNQQCVEMFRRLKRFFRKHRLPILGTTIALFILYWNAQPKALFDDPVCNVIEDEDGNLLSATIASDGQWRFPPTDHVPEKFEKAILAFEDKRFYRHIGIDVWAMGRAVRENIRDGSVVSGGSTITMQVMRLSRKGKSRNLWQKLTEMILATRLELATTKEKILQLYASHAPFGGNVVGLDAAAWRYFAKSPEKLSWAEAACLAVLPNSPALVNPGRNRETLRTKRNGLLTRMCAIGVFDSITLELALSEPLPSSPHPLPQVSMHLLNRASLEGELREAVLRTTLNIELQQATSEIIERHGERLAQNGIHNAAAIVVEVETGDVRAYVGNTKGDGEAEHGHDVDIIKSPRSTGSILKPFLYASMLHDGALLPHALVQDVPTKYGSFTPTNFNQDYDGAAPASKALARSLNVPAVRMLLDYRLERFYQRLKQLGMTTLTKPPNYYGLSLILGGAEATLWDLVTMYSSMARTLNRYSQSDGSYFKQDWRQPKYTGQALPAFQTAARRQSREDISTAIDIARAQRQPPVLSAAAIWHTFEAMVEVNRPEERSSWRAFGNAQRIAWKTGTSYGHRDAWAVGVTPKYVVGIWCGNADGEGRPGLVGVQAAAPILFEVFNALPSSSWFPKPHDDMVVVAACPQTGYRASDICPDKVFEQVPSAGKYSKLCPYHHIVHLDPSERFQVTSACMDMDAMVHKSWLVLPPAVELYYRRKHPDYKPLPPFRDDCQNAPTELQSMELIYPKLESRIYVPIEIDGTPGKIVFEAAHRRPSTKIYWHIDNEFIGVTSGTHQLALRPASGERTLTLVDENGERITQVFEVLEKSRQ